MSARTRRPVLGTRPADTKVSVVRSLTTAAALLTLFALAACGGGGGEESPSFGGGPPPTPAPPPPAPVPPPPAPAPAPSPTVTSFTTDPATIPVGSGTTTVVVRYATTNTRALTVTLGSETKPVVAGSGEVSFVRQGEGDLPVVLKEGGVQLGNSIVSTASCSAEAKWDPSVTTPICREVLAHTDVVVGVWDLNGRFYFVGKQGSSHLTTENGFTRVKAMSDQYVFGGIRKGVTDEFCRIRVVASVFEPSVGYNVWRQMYVDAKRGELHVLPGTENVLDFDPRADYDFVHDSGTTPGLTAYAQVSSGEYYTRAEAEFNLHFRPTGQDPELILSWDFFEQGNLKVMRTSTCR